jgi:hypothetical protein
MLKYIRSERVWLREHPEYGERWLQQQTAEEPAILGLGDVVPLSREVVQSNTRPSSLPELPGRYYRSSMRGQWEVVRQAPIIRRWIACR